ncbi:MAG: hypothetical protein P0Y62_14295 [Candidatus Chryseobacterium colombiense]|nr:hypothetical protein [Chryseobacterium sp.]WEK69011.1 MAG: hypothetical protein P0Y62_14295 [Chryseobacterium sp.]
MSDIGKIIRVNALPPPDKRENNVIYQVAAPGAATYKDYAIDANGDLKTPSYIPLTGTEEGKPLTKNIEVDPSEDGSVGFVSNTPDTSEAVLAIQEDDSILAKSHNSSENSSSSIHIHYDNGIEISATISDEQFSAILDTSGLKGDHYIPPTSDEHYVQKKFVADNFTSQPALNSTLTNYYTKSETYNKAEVDAKLSAVYRPKGSVANFASLPTTGNTEGDVWNILDTGANYVWVLNLNNTGTPGWDKLSETVDLTNYVTINTEQTVEARKTFNGATNNTYTGAAIMVNGNQTIGAYPTIAFHQPGSHAGTISLRDPNQFSFRNISDSDYIYLTAKGFNKDGSSDSYVLTGGGGHKLISDFVDKTTGQDITGFKNFITSGGNNYGNNTLRIVSIDGSNPAVTFNKSGVVAGQLKFKEDGYHFLDPNSGYRQIKAAAFIKDGYDDNWILLGGGGSKLISDFALSSQLGNYVNKSGDTMTGALTAPFFKSPYFGYAGLAGDQIMSASTDTIYAGNTSLPTFRIESTNDIIHWKNGVGPGTIWTTHNFNPTNYVTINTPQAIIADKYFSQTAKLTIYGNESSNQNNTQSFNTTSGNGNIVSGWVNTFYNSCWKYGTVRGGDSSSSDVKFGFDFSTDGGITYNRMFDIDGNTGLVRANSISAKGGTDKLIYDNIENYGSPIKINANASLGIQLQANGSTIFEVRPTHVESNKNLYITNDYVIYTTTSNSNYWSIAYTDGLVNRSNGFQSNIDANNLGSQKSEIISLELGNGTGNTNFPNNSGYGNFLKMSSRAFTSEFFHETNGSLSHRNWYFSGGGNPTDIPFRQLWDNVNLPNPASQSDLGSYQTLSTDQNISASKSYYSTTPFTFKNINYKSWVFHKPSSNNLIFAPSLSNNADDFDWANQIEFTDSGNIITKAFTASSAVWSNTFNSGILAGNTFIATNSTEIYFGNNALNSVYYQTHTSHYFMVNGVNVGSFSSSGLGVNGALSVNGNNVWHGGNFNPADYVPISGNVDIFSTKRFTGISTEWILDADATTNARGFLQSMGSGFFTGTVNDKDYGIYRNGVQKMLIQDSTIAFNSNVILGTNNLSTTGVISAFEFNGNIFSSNGITGNQVFNANNVNVLVFGNDDIPNVYYTTLGNHTFINNGITRVVITNSGLSVSGALAVNGSNAITEAQRGIANGFAPLGSDAKISSAYLPSYVDDVLEFANLASFPATGESGKIYVAIDTNLTYRWGGSSYIQISSGAVQSINGQTGVVNLSKSDLGLSNVDNTSDGTKNVLASTKWTTPRTLSYIGDVTGSASVDGSGNVGIAMTLANSGVSAGTYNNVNVDAKGRVLSGNNVNYATESYVTDLLQQNYFNQAASDERFVNTEGDETINGNKTFSSSPSIPAATSGDHAVNLEQLAANLAHVVNDNDDFKFLEVYKLIDSNPIDLDDTSIKKYNIIFDGSSNGSVNITHLRDNQYYQFSNVSGSGADLRVGVEGYGMIDVVSSGKTAVYMSWGGGKLLKISENANVSII